MTYLAKLTIPNPEKGSLVGGRAIEKSQCGHTGSVAKPQSIGNRSKTIKEHFGRSWSNSPAKTGFVSADPRRLLGLVCEGRASSSVTEETNLPGESHPRKASGTRFLRRKGVASGQIEH